MHMQYRCPGRSGRNLVACLALLVTLLTACRTPSPPGATPAGPAPTDTLVLYDTTGQYGFLGELGAMQAGNLASHFGAWTGHPVSGYAKGELDRYRAVVYVGSTYDEPLPAAFLDDVADARRPVLWLDNNIWQLTARHPELPGRFGFTAGQFDPAAVAEVRYRGTSLTRAAADAGPLLSLAVTDPARATPVAEAVHGDGTTVPWGVRSGTFTYLGELPFTFLGPDDRYLAFADLLYDVLAPGTPARHRALVRIEDVGPQSDPAQLRAIADYLAGRGVPFSVAVFVQYDDPAGRYTGGLPVHRRLSDTPELVAALKYLVAHGGTLLMHGTTHGYAGAPNPYGVSAQDFEYYRAHLDAATNRVLLDGPVPEDSAAWVTARIADARAEWAKVGLPEPDIFEFPHYAASALDYRTVSAAMGIRYERAMYFSGVLSGAAVDHSRYTSQLFPYLVKDVYGARVIPETLGNVEIQSFNQHEARLPDAILASARRQLVVRDGVASFFYHPFLGLQYLPSLVEGIQALGYSFVSARDVLA
jgi:uncharacterized protein YdaL